MFPPNCFYEDINFYPCSKLTLNEKILNKQEGKKDERERGREGRKKRLRESVKDVGGKNR